MNSILGLFLKLVIARLKYFLSDFKIIENLLRLSTDLKNFIILIMIIVYPSFFRAQDGLIRWKYILGTTKYPNFSRLEATFWFYYSIIQHFHNALKRSSKATLLHLLPLHHCRRMGHSRPLCQSAAWASQYNPKRGLSHENMGIQKF